MDDVTVDIDDLRKARTADRSAVATGPILESLELYWNSLRHAAQIPARNDIEPSKIDHVLPHAFILQRVAPGTARMRVAGQRLHDLLKMDARGMPLTTLFHGDARDQIRDLLETTFLRPAIVEVPLVSPGSLIRPEISGRMLLLPLNDHLGRTNRLLGALVTDIDETRRPRRFIIPQGAQLRHEVIGPHLVAHAGAGRAASAGEAVTEAPQHRSPAPPKLRLVVNNG